jgi:hypothetical protein
VCAGEKKALVKAALDGNLRRVKGTLFSLLPPLLRRARPSHGLLLLASEGRPVGPSSQYTIVSY